MLLLYEQAVIGGSEDSNQEKKALDAFKGDDFMELKFRMMKKLEATSEVKRRDSFGVSQAKFGTLRSTHTNTRLRRVLGSSRKWMLRLVSWSPCFLRKCTPRAPRSPLTVDFTTLR